MAAAAIRSEVTARIETLLGLSLSPAYGVHTLFAGLYVETNRRLLAVFDRLPDPGFAYLAMTRFLQLYDLQVAGPVQRGEAIAAPRWRAYAAMAERTSLTSPISAHLWLISLGAEAHVRHDLADALRLAVLDHRRLFGRGPDLETMRAALLGHATSLAFFEATLDFNRMHRGGRHHGWRRVALILHVGLAWITRPLMLGVLQAWRRTAWREAMAAPLSIPADLNDLSRVTDGLRG